MDSQRTAMLCARLPIQIRNEFRAEAALAGISTQQAATEAILAWLADARDLRQQGERS